MIMMSDYRTESIENWIYAFFFESINVKVIQANCSPILYIHTYKKEDNWENQIEIFWSYASS